jgi:uncharacterized protein (DUF2141 family)
MAGEGLVTRALFLAAACVAISNIGYAVADPVSAGAISVRLLGLRSDHGRAGCMLFGSDKGFPGDPRAALQKTWCTIAKGEATCYFEPVRAAVYAVACFHDENGNGKLDTGLFGIPKEGTAASNDAKGRMGPPKFQDAKFSFPGSDTQLRLRVGY